MMLRRKSPCCVDRPRRAPISGRFLILRSFSSASLLSFAAAPDKALPDYSEGVVFFDLDDTLIDVNRCAARCLRLPARA